MLRRSVFGLTLVIAVSSAAGPVIAQPPAGFRGPVFRVEPETRSDHTRPGFVTGWIYNEGQGVAGLVRMRVEMLDGSGKVVAQHVGWAYGNVAPGGRAYFMIPIPPQSPPERRVSVDSFVLQSFESPGQSQSP
jgi:hypothetical protein